MKQQSSHSPLSSYRSAEAAAAIVEAAAASSTHACGFASESDAMDGSRNRTVHKRPETYVYVTEKVTVNIRKSSRSVLDPVFNVESDGGLRNGRSLRHF